MARKDRTKLAARTASPATTNNQENPTVSNPNEQFSDANEPSSQPGQMTDGTSSEGVSSGAVTAIGDTDALQAAGADQAAVAEVRELTDAAAERTVLKVELPEGASPEQALQVIESAVAAVPARGETQTFVHIDEAAFKPVAPTGTAAATSAAVAAAPAAPLSTVAVNTQSGPLIPAIAGTPSRLAQSLYAVVETYIKTVPPRTPVEPSTLIQQQVYLYRAITGIINKLEGEEFTEAWSWLLACFHEHRKGVFGERHVFRAMEEVTLSPDDRKAFQRLLNLLILTCEASSRPYALRQIDMAKTLAIGLTEPGRQRLHAYYGV